MKQFKNLYRFLGSIPFAVTLLALTACFMGVGTWIESWTDSHRSAIQFIYHSLFFKLLLLGFFINILVSTLQRWPFRWKHLPFLTTHLGLLMIIAGVFVKNSYGVQGALELTEGSGSHHFFCREEPILSLGKKDSPKKDFYSLKFSAWGSPQLLPPPSKNWADVQVKLLSYAPHSEKKISSWIDQEEGRIRGLKPFQVHRWEEKEALPPFSGQVKLHHSEAAPWRLYAFRTSQVEKLAQELFLQTAEIAISDTQTDHLLDHLPLREALFQPISWKEGNAKLALEFNFSALTGFNQPCVKAEGFYKQPFKIKIPLTGNQALINQNEGILQLGKAPLSLDLVCSPSLVLIEDEEGEIYLLAFDSNGEVYSQLFSKEALDKRAFYDQAAGSYIVDATLPFSNLPNTRKDKEAARLHHLAIQLRQILLANPTLPPPARLLEKACLKGSHDFASSFLLFLQALDKQGSWVISLSTSLPNELNLLLQSLDWNTLSPSELKACQWIALLSPELESRFCSGENLSLYLQEKGWPSPTLPLAKKPFTAFMADFTQQVYALSQALPPLDNSLFSSATLLSAYFRLHSLQLSPLQNFFEQACFSDICARYFATQFLESQLQEILQVSNGYSSLIETLPENAPAWHALQHACQVVIPFFFQGESEDQLTKEEIRQLIALTLPLPPGERVYPSQKLRADLAAAFPVTLDSPLSYRYSPLPSLKKLEENIPLLRVSLTKGTKEAESHTLAFKARGSVLDPLILGGEYQLGFHAKIHAIPYHLRLRRARQIPYAHSSQTYSYECDLWVTDLTKGTQIEATLSMNQVYETRDGYRFYLANISSADEMAAKKVQIIVNYDPAKYLLTYPGAFILSLGIFLLFWASTYRGEK